jgi:hypothetical protein
MQNPRTRVVILVGVVVLSKPAWAVRYELEKGEPYGLCRAYVQALNSVDRKLPMACKRRFPEDFKKFRKPRWKSLDPNSMAMAFWRQLYDIQSRALNKQKNTDKGWSIFKSNRLKISLENDLIDMDKTRVDIDFDGKTDTVIRVRMRYGIGGCEAESRAWFVRGEGPPPEEYRYYVLNEDTGSVDPRFGSFVLSGGTYHDLFYYEGRPYIDSFGGVSVEYSKRVAAKSSSTRITPAPEGRIYVLEPERTEGGVAGRPVCQVKVFYQLGEVDRR